MTTQLFQRVVGTHSEEGRVNGGAPLLESTSHVDELFALGYQRGHRILIEAHVEEYIPDGRCRKLVVDHHCKKKNIAS